MVRVHKHVDLGEKNHLEKRKKPVLILIGILLHEHKKKKEKVKNLNNFDILPKRV